MLSGVSFCTAIRLDASKGVQNLFYARPGVVAAAARRQRHGLHFAAGALHVVIHDDEIILREVLHFLSRALQPPGDFFPGVLPAGAQAALQLLPRRRHDEDGDGTRQFLHLHLLRSLDVNLQHQVEALALRLLEPLPRRAIPILAEDAGVLKELALRHHALEFGLGKKIIPFPRALRGARLSRGARDGKHRARQLEELFHQGGFPGARGPRDDQYQRLLRFRHLHSTFCTCSRSFSISDLTSSPRSVMANPSASIPGVFESMVFASRCISCSRKSSFLPSSPPAASSL